MNPSDGLLFCSLQSSACSTNSDGTSDEGDLVPVLVPNNPERGCVFIFDKSKGIEETNEHDEYMLVHNNDNDVNSNLRCFMEFNNSVSVSKPSVAKNPDEGGLTFDKSALAHATNGHDECMLSPHNDNTITCIINDLINEISQSIIGESILERKLSTYK